MLYSIHSFAPLESNLKTMKNTFGIQLKNHEKRFWQASSGRSTRPRKRSYQTAAAMPGEVAKRGCTRARCSTSGSRDYADSNDSACDARHGARVVQIARCSASTSKTAFNNSTKCSQTFSHFQNLILKVKYQLPYV